jgi:hypothetical protein
MRLTARADDLIHSDIIKDDRDQAQRQRSRMEEIKVIFFKEVGEAKRFLGSNALSCEL